MDILIASISCHSCEFLIKFTELLICISHATSIHLDFMCGVLGHFTMAIEKQGSKNREIKLASVFRKHALIESHRVYWLSSLTYRAPWHLHLLTAVLCLASAFLVGVGVFWPVPRYINSLGVVIAPKGSVYYFSPVEGELHFDYKLGDFLSKGQVLAEVHNPLCQNIYNASEVSYQNLAKSECSPFKIIAEANGVIAHVFVGSGTYVEKGERFALTIPALLGSFMQARLSINSGSAGEIKVGQTVTMRFKDFPYRRYGIAHGNVVMVDRVLLPSAKNGAPVLEVVVSLEGFGPHIDSSAIKPGMELMAEILVSNETVLQWLFPSVSYL